MLSSKDFTSLQFYKKRRNVLLYKGVLEGKNILLKCTFSKDPALIEALMDEYHVMSQLSHPGIPAYFWIQDTFYLPDRAEPVWALCMEDCSKKSGYLLRHLMKDTSQPVPKEDTPSFSPKTSVPSGRMVQGNIADWNELTLAELLAVLGGVCDILSRLLECGILYTDLNPSNLILHRSCDGLSVSLVDYTFSYFFIENPYPAYSLRFSYDLSPDLKGQQLLIQELSFLLRDMLEERNDPQIPSGIYRLMETGLKPSCHLMLSDYSVMIGNTMEELC